MSRPPPRPQRPDRLCTIKLLPLKLQNGKLDSRRSSTKSAIAVEDILCKERMDAKSPDLWPEQVRGVTRFISSVMPLGSVPLVDNAQSEWTSEFSAEEFNLLRTLTSLSESAIMEQVKEYHNVSYQLGLEEAHEMTRGNLLYIFNCQRL